MRVYRSLEEVPPGFGPSAVTIGNFDGVHGGHRQILRRLKALWDAHGWKPTVLTFDPHPTAVVAPERAPKLMTSCNRRAELMAEEGIQQVIILPFNREIAQLSPEEFVKSLLVDRLDARAVLVGQNFRFGHRQAGNTEVLKQLGERFGFGVEIVPAVAWRGRMVSSSKIRELIQAGLVSQAGRFLQQPYCIEGAVVSGRGVGSKQTVPTLNLSTTAEVIPARGVYVTRTRDLDSGREWNSITNIGYRPTFGQSDELTIETFLLGPLETGPDGSEETPHRIRVSFLHRVRDERQFASPEALKTQIFKDVRTAQNYFRRSQLWIGRACPPVIS
jgi:riboflavin kinase/FMN adenylyltransferase